MTPVRLPRNNGLFRLVGTRSMKALLLTALVILSGCATQSGEIEARYGRVEQLESVMVDGDSRFGVGTVIGAVAGGILGNQIGGGSGKAVATAAGVVAGGVIGNKVENKHEKRPGHRVVVRLDGGGSVGVTQPADQNLRVGDRVRIDGSGEDARVVRF
ncbi:MAG TPA: glycine zipper 2TM domain-containing protein [Roseimicrobium sp.]|nr:glycine zipper 2TM domain-containing protein [Roseimicrobium sp.]